MPTAVKVKSRISGLMSIGVRRVKALREGLLPDHRFNDLSNPGTTAGEIRTGCHKFVRDHLEPLGGAEGTSTRSAVVFEKTSEAHRNGHQPILQLLPRKRRMVEGKEVQQHLSQTVRPPFARRRRTYNVTGSHVLERTLPP